MKKNIAVMLTATLLVNQIPFTCVSAESQNQNTVQAAKTAEYIVQAENPGTYYQVMEDRQEDIVEQENSEELEAQRMIVLELTEKEVGTLSRNENIAFVEENILLSASASKKKNKEQKTQRINEKEALKNECNDCGEKQWYLDAIHLPEKAEGRENIKIAVLDSGISYSTDIDVEKRISIDEEKEADNPLFDDASGHGTSLAGVIAAKDNAEGIRGINPQAELYSIQVLDENNQATLSQVIAGIYQAMEWDCDILNMSFGTEYDSELLHQAIRDAYDDGMLLIAAAGNQKEGEVEYPAAYDEVLAVGSSDATGNKTDATSDGKEIEIFAPGSQIITTGLFGGTLVTEGTSIATAQVSGAASLLWSLDKDKDAGFIRSLLVSTTQKMEFTGQSDGGLLDIENAMQQYDALEKVYQPKVLEYIDLQSDSAAEDFGGIELINGSWTQDNHDEMAKNAAKEYNIKSDYVRLMQKAARWADDEYHGVNRFHATGNYVMTLKFLYLCAGYIREGKSVDDSVSLASKGAKLLEGKEDKNKYDTQLRDAVKATLKRSILTGVSESSKEAKYYKVMGLAMHVTGDTFAHRTIVPKYTVKGTNPKEKKESKSVHSYDAMFGYGDFKEQSTHQIESDSKLKMWAKGSYKYKDSICKRWKCFQRTVNLGVMEFKDIKNYAIKNQKQYEDDANFCKERYVDAKLACVMLFGSFYEKDSFDGVYILFPTEENVKLNNLKNYAKEAGEDTSILTSEEWKNVSTPEFY